ncbi:MAG: SUMF1/EgtB/PvdO family nonheme iron enzyme [FCB group bacterium]|nr:SUMF1/EgtB/PvdO family nonheme iron enzyme [FCB group bacterium]
MDAKAGKVNRFGLVALLVCVFFGSRCAWGVPGDINGNGAVNAVDIQIIINAAVGFPGGFNADVNNDGTVNAVDIQLVINLALGKGFTGRTNVPGVVGMPQAVAEAALFQAALTVGAVTEEYSATISTGNVLAQNPAARTSTLPYTPVNLTVSKGPPPVEVPNLVGSTQAGAESAIRAAGLTPGELNKTHSATVAPDIVMDQSPEAGSVVVPGLAVDMVVSAGPPPVEVPNVTGMTEEEALDAITAANLTTGTVTGEYSTTVPPGSIISQTLSADGTTVDLVVSKGPNPIGPSASFTVTPRTGGTPLVVQFTDTSDPGTEDIASWAWDFGDGATSTASSPAHTYTQAGAYSVSLTITTLAGSNTERRVDYIAVTGALAEVAVPGAQIVTRGQVFDGQATVPYWDLVGIVKDGVPYLYCPAMGPVELTPEASRRAVGWWLATQLSNNQKRLTSALQLATGLVVSPNGTDHYAFENRNNRWTAVVNAAEVLPVFVPGQGSLVETELLTAMAAREPVVAFVSAPSAAVAVSGSPVYTYGSVTRSPLWPYILGTTVTPEDAPAALTELLQAIRQSADVAMAQDSETFVRLNAVESVTLIFEAIAAVTGQFPGACAATLADDATLQSLKSSLLLILSDNAPQDVDPYLQTLDGLAQAGALCGASEGAAVDALVGAVLDIVAGANWIVDDALVATIDPATSLAFAQVEGIPPSVTSFRVNAAEITASRAVTLNVACAGEPLELMASESADFSGATWKAYSSTVAFTITSIGNGTKTVYLKARNAAGESAAASDTILLNEAAGGTEETVILPGNVPMAMVWIPAGTFSMGRVEDEKDSFATEDPRHSVTFASGAWLGKYEVTKAQWTAVMGTTPWTGQTYVSTDPGTPAVYVTWEAAQAFITALNNCTGKVFRLPSEALWEYACRAGTTTRFYWGDDLDYTQINDYAWWDNNAYSAGERYAHAVGLRLPNAFGLYDMSGNVWEWCEDDWHPNYTGAPANGLPWINATRGTARVVRGGGWSSYGGYYCRSANRIYIHKANSAFYIGLRVSR